MADHATATAEGLRRVRGEPHRSNSWPDKLIELVTQLWKDGVPARQIGRQVGKSNNAIIGKVRRLGLSGRGSPIIRDPNAPPKPKPERARPRPPFEQPPRVALMDFPPPPPLPPPSEAPPPPPPPPAPAAAPIAELELAKAPPPPPRPVQSGRGCQFPLWGNHRPPSPPPFCGQPVRLKADGTPSSYCAEHHARVYQPGRPRWHP